MSSSSRPGDSRPAPQAESANSTPPIDLVAGARMLEQILEATAKSTPEEREREPEEIKALRAVAKTYAGEPFVLQPVAIEMIHAILHIQFKQADIPAQTVRTMAQHIATTLYEDPPSHQRLQALWLSLSGR